MAPRLVGERQVHHPGDERAAQQPQVLGQVRAVGAGAGRAGVRGLLAGEGRGGLLVDHHRRARGRATGRCGADRPVHAHVGARLAVAAAAAACAGRSPRAARSPASRRRKGAFHPRWKKTSAAFTSRSVAAGVVVDRRGRQRQLVERVGDELARRAARGCRSPGSAGRAPPARGAPASCSAVSERSATGAEKTSCGVSPRLPQASARSFGVEAPPTSGNSALPQRMDCSVNGVRVATRPCHSVVPSLPSASATETTSSFPSGTSSSRVSAQLAGSWCDGAGQRRQRVRRHLARRRVGEAGEIANLHA